VRVERSAGGVVLRRIADEVHVLLILDPYENWGLPKGHLEKGESPREAAVREVREETGLASLRLGREVGAIDWYFRHRGRLIHKFCTFFLMSSPRGEAAPAVAEGITVCRWVPLSDAVDDISYDNAREVLERAVAALEGDVDVAADLFTED
jgi:8-oxo-dGTP pyrophosphatase MutT (NUDIX family)